MAEEWAHVLEDGGGIGDQNVALLLTGNFWWIGAQSGNKLVNDIGGLLCIYEIYSRNQSSTNYRLSQGYYTCYILTFSNISRFCLRNTIKIYVNWKRFKSVYTHAFKNILLTSQNKTFRGWSGSWSMMEVTDDSLGSACNKGSFVSLVLKEALCVVKNHLEALLLKEAPFVVKDHL